jgi:hypothetical protein
MARNSKADTHVAQETQAQSTDLASYDALYQEELTHNLDGVIPRLPLIRILHAGALLFEVQDDLTCKPKRVEHVEGVILDHQRVNAWWEVEYARGGNRHPDCWSLDAKRPDATAFKIQSERCPKCPQNQYGSKGRGKACKNMCRLLLKVQASLLPYILTAPPTSLKELDRYLTALTNARIPASAAVTLFTLTAAKNDDGIAYSLLTPVFRDTIPVEEWAKAIVPLKQQFKDFFRQQTIEAEEYWMDLEDEEGGAQ